VTAAPGLDALTQAIRDAGGDEVVGDAASSAVDCRLPAPSLPALADRLSALGLEPQWIAAADTRAASGAFTLAYRFAPPTHRPAVTLRSGPTARRRVTAGRWAGGGEGGGGVGGGGGGRRSAGA